mgnify:CR=1 FL=1
MQKARVRIWSLLLVCFMLLTMIPTGAFAAEDKAGKTVDSAFQVGENLYSTLDAAMNAGDTITLTKDATFTTFTLSNGEELTIDLMGHELSSTGGADITISDSAKLTIQSTSEKGTLNMTGFSSVNTAAITVTTESSVELNNVNYTTDGTGLFPRGDAATVTVENCTLNTEGYCLGTNAGAVDNYLVKITLSNSIFNASPAEGAAGTAMYLNVPGTLEMDTCEVNGYMHGMFIRGGTAIIKNSTITNTMDDDSLANYFDGKSWGSGNTVNLAALTLGDKSKSNDSSSYRYPTEVTLENTTVKMEGSAKDSYPAIYLYQMNDTERQVTLNIQGEQGNYDGDISVNNNDVNGKTTAKVSITGGTFTDNVSEYVADGCTLLGDAENGYYVVAEGNIPDEDAVASIGNSFYSSLAAAVDMADPGDIITMVKGTQLSSVITIDKAITLDLNGQTITATGISDNANPIQVLEHGKLTIKDSAGQGAIEATTPLSVEGGSLILENGKISVKNTTNGYGIYVSENGSVTVNGGEISSTYAPLSGNNTTGDMNFTVNGGTLTAESGPAIYMPGQVNLTITDGTLNGGISLRMGQVDISGGTINATKGSIDPIDQFYDYSGNAWLPDALYVFNGTYTSENAEHGNSLNLNITGGTFTCENDQGGAITIYDLGKVEQKSSITISGKAKLVTNAKSREAYQVLNLEEVGVSSPAEGYGKHSGDVKTAITGGMFSKQPAASYIANGYVVVNSGDANYPYLIQKAEPVGEAEAVAEVADPSVDDSQLSHLTEDQQKDVVAAAESVEVSSDVMQEQSKTALEEVKKDGTIVADAVQALNTELAQGSVTAAGVTLFVQAYLNITPTEYKPEETTLTFDITPMSRVVASTEKDSEKLVIKGEETSSGTANAVIVGEPKQLTVNKQVTITLTLPENFIIQDTAYVVHTKGDNTQYLYDGTVDASSVLTFINPNGFSNFTVYGADPAVARVYASDETEGETGTGYMTLQQAIGAVKDNGYIVVKKDDSASVSRSISFTVSEENNAVASISAGRGYRMTKVENENGSVTYTFSRRSSSSSNSGSTGGIGSPLPVAGSGSTPSVTGFESDTSADLTVNGRYQFRITSLDGHTPVLTVNNANFTVALASQNGRDYFYVITCAGTPGSTAAVSVDGKYLLTATVGGSASGVVSDTTHPFTVAQGGTYQFRLTAAARPSFAAGSASFTVEYAGQEGNDYFYKVHAVGQAGDGCGFYINGEAQPVAVATIA